MGLGYVGFNLCLKGKVYKVTRLSQPLCCIDVSRHLGLISTHAIHEPNAHSSTGGEPAQKAPLTYLYYYVS